MTGASGCGAAGCGAAGGTGASDGAGILFPPGAGVGFVPAAPSSLAFNMASHFCANTLFGSTVVVVLAVEVSANVSDGTIS